MGSKDEEQIIDFLSNYQNIFVLCLFIEFMISFNNFRYYGYNIQNTCHSDVSVHLSSLSKYE